MVSILVEYCDGCGADLGGDYAVETEVISNKGEEGHADLKAVHCEYCFHDFSKEMEVVLTKHGFYALHSGRESTVLGDYTYHRTKAKEKLKEISQATSQEQE